MHLSWGKWPPARDIFDFESFHSSESPLGAAPSSRSQTFLQDAEEESRMELLAM